MLGRNREQQFCLRRGLQMLGLLKPDLCLLVVCCPNVQIAEYQELVFSLRRCCYDLFQQALSFPGMAGGEVSLRHSGHPVNGRRIQAQTMLIGIQGSAQLAVEPGRISQQQPELRVVGSCLCGTLRIAERLGMIATLQRQLGRPGQTGILDV